MKVESEEEKQAVACETNITVYLNHPNVIKLFGVISVKHKKCGIMMETSDYGSLQAR